MQDSAKASGIDLAQIKPTLRAAKLSAENTPNLSSSNNIPGPTREDVEAAREMSGADRMAFIQSMVDRLAARLKEEPNDIQGWKRLARAYQVLGELEKAGVAKRRIRELESRGN